MTHTKVRLVIADSDPILRYDFRQLLSEEADFEVVGEASDGVEAWQMASELKPEILLLELAMPRRLGMDVLRELPRMPSDATAVRVVVLTTAANKWQVLEALQLGAHGVVVKDWATLLLVKAIRAVMAGRFWIGQENVSNITQFLRTLMLSQNHELFHQKNFGLTPRELKVLSLVVAGYSNRQIADQCNIGEDFVKRHLSNMFDKLSVSSRPELALFAVNHRLPLQNVDGMPPRCSHDDREDDDGSNRV